jgi:hypothetical protein
MRSPAGALTGLFVLALVLCLALLGSAGRVAAQQPSQEQIAAIKASCRSD